MRRQRGSGAVELAVIAPAFVFAILFVVVVARVGVAQLEVRNAAHQAARAATLERDPGAAAGAAVSVGLQSMQDAGLGCAGGGDVNPSVGGLTPGGTVSVSVTCIASFGDLGWGFGGAKTLTASAVEVVEEKRAFPGG